MAGSTPQLSFSDTSSMGLPTDYDDSDAAASKPVGITFRGDSLDDMMTTGRNIQSSAMSSAGDRSEIMKPTKAALEATPVNAPKLGLIRPTEESETRGSSVETDVPERVAAGE